ncbi:hypothetical protein M3J09_012336 [Ascochyta lentis]
MHPCILSHVTATNLHRLLMLTNSAHLAST